MTIIAKINTNLGINSLLEYLHNVFPGRKFICELVKTKYRTENYISCTDELNYDDRMVIVNKLKLTGTHFVDVDNIVYN